MGIVRQFATGFLLLGLAACGPEEIGGSYSGRNHSNIGGQEDEGGGEPAVPETIYATGVEYPKGYNWRADQDNDLSECTLFLIKDGKRILELPVGSEYCVSSSSDQHRVISGSLYTDYSTADETIVRKDGDELYRYSGREMIVGMIVKEGDVYTLCRPRSGDGWTYRVNGEAVMGKSAGTLTGGLYEDGGHILFSYSEPLSQNMTRHYLVEDGRIISVGSQNDIIAIHAIRMIGSRIHYLAELKGIGNNLVLYVDSESRLYDIPPGILREASILPASDGCFVTAAVHYTGSMFNTALRWRNAEPMKSMGREREPYWFYTDNESLYCLAGRGEDNILWMYRDDEVFSIESGYSVLDRNGAAVMDGKFYVALFPRTDGLRPALWVDNEVVAYDFNGYFTGIYVE